MFIGNIYIRKLILDVALFDIDFFAENPLNLDKLYSNPVN